MELYAMIFGIVRPVNWKSEACQLGYAQARRFELSWFYSPLADVSVPAVRNGQVLVENDGLRLDGLRFT